MIFSDTLQCHWIAIVPVDDETVEIIVPFCNCSDMRGAIQVAQAVMPDVKVIEIRTGGYRDTRYERVEGKKWTAYTRPTISRLVAGKQKNPDLSRG